MTTFKTNIKPSKKKKKPVIRKRIKTLVPPPDWDRLKKAQTEEQMLHSFKECEEFVHHEVTEKEYLHSMKKWVRDFSGWGVENVTKLPDVYLLGVAKQGWKAIRLGFMPKEYNESLKRILLPMYKDADRIRARMNYEPLIHPSVANLEEDHKLHPDKVKVWIAAWKKNSDQFSKQYVNHMQHYLRHGVWLDTFYGLNRDKTATPYSVALAYDKDGIAKRTKGVFYPDIGRVWK